MNSGNKKSEGSWTCNLLYKVEDVNMDIFEKYEIDSGKGLKAFLEAAGLTIRNWSGIEGSQNIIYLPDLTTFNWKSANRIVRINCKEHAMRVIESKTDLVHVDNVKGDPTRVYSFIIDSLSDLIDAIVALKSIEGNAYSANWYFIERIIYMIKWKRQ